MNKEFIKELILQESLAIIPSKYNNIKLKDYLLKDKFKTKKIYDVEKIISKINEVAFILSKYEEKDILMYTMVNKYRELFYNFSKLFNFNSFKEKVLLGFLSNIKHTKYTNSKVLFCANPFYDKGIINEAKNNGKIVISFVDTNNSLLNLDYFIPINLSSKKSIISILFLIYVEYLRIRKNIDLLNDFNYEKFYLDLINSI